jgi:hypothetical protein
MIGKEGKKEKNHGKKIEASKIFATETNTELSV